LEVPRLKICFVLKEIFNWGRYGGFGKTTREIGETLAKRGHEVFVVVPKSPGQKTLENLDGITVYGIPCPTSLSRPWKWHYVRGVLLRIFSPFFHKKCKADIYHSINPSVYSFLAKTIMWKKKHIISFRDLRVRLDWERMSAKSPMIDWYYSKRRYLNIIDSPLIKTAVSLADDLNASAHFLIAKSMRAFNLKKPPSFLPNPCKIPKRKIKKSEDPMVCFLARLDAVKRPYIFFRLAKDFPDVRFVVMGQCHNPPEYEKMVKAHSNIPNLTFMGWTFGELKSSILEKAWVLVNTSIHEGLPNAFLEAWAHQCAVLSSTNPDNLVGRYGYYANERDKDFATGLKKLLENDQWREKGEKGYHYVRETHEFEKVLKQQIQLYRNVLS